MVNALYANAHMSLGEGVKLIHIKPVSYKGPISTARVMRVLLIIVNHTESYVSTRGTAPIK
jgi:hypothetical protein